ncbi:MAG: TatD family hydrolase [Clostridiales bacterium]|nr:TatD family hydrolase [Clostridiales bacterium]
MSARPIETPDLGAPVPDTHAHLDMLDDPVAALTAAARAGVTFVATVVDVTEEPGRTFDGLAGWLAAADPAPGEVRIIVGCHPHNAKDFSAEAQALLRMYAADPRVAAIGETGLDFHYDNSPRDKQRAAFRTQLAIAREFDVPVVVHLREAHDEGIAILEEIGVPKAGCVIHCFTADTALAERFVAMGCHISFAGPVTFKKAAALRETAAAVPADRLLVESDCPFLAPEPYRGRANEPAFVTYTAAALARARGEDILTFASSLSANARAIFSRPRGRR